MLVSFHDLARLELNEAAEYYESESAGLGQAFITEVERCTDDIVRYPEAGSAVPEPAAQHLSALRSSRAKTFPYRSWESATPPTVSNNVRVIVVPFRAVFVSRAGSHPVVPEWIPTPIEAQASWNKE
jgi:hypothetical protein